jgi:adenine C2-methylase RlmN of 23S rRNA A2503 and tRNA A37
MNCTSNSGRSSRPSTGEHKDGSRWRAYQLQDGQLIESVLMPYRYGLYTTFTSAQVVFGSGWVFCATR